MKKQGFIALPILLAIVLGLAALGGGAYFVMQKKEISCPINSAWDGQECRATGDLGHITQSVPPTQPPQDDNLITIISPTVGGNLLSDKKTTVKWDISSTTISSFPQDFNLYVMLYARRLGNEGLNYPVGDGYDAKLGSAQWDIPAYMTNKQLEVGTYKIVAGLQAEPKDRTRMCAETIGKDCSPNATDRSVMSRASTIKGESGWFTVGTTQTKTYTNYGPHLLESFYEGYDRLSYDFSYPESDFSITNSQNNQKIIIKEIATGKIDTVNITDESGRGMSPQDYWNYTLKPSCADCAPVANPISIKNTQGLATFANKDREWVIFYGGGAWLFVAELQKPAIEAEKILSSFSFSSAK